MFRVGLHFWYIGRLWSSAALLIFSFLLPLLQSISYCPPNCTFLPFPHQINFSMENEIAIIWRLLMLMSLDFTYITFCFLIMLPQNFICSKAFVFIRLQDGLTVPTSSICQMQSLLLLIMSYVANGLVCNKASAQVISDQVESSCFVDAAIVFCKLQHLNRTTPVKTQVSYLLRELI